MDEVIRAILFGTGIGLTVAGVGVAGVSALLVAYAAFLDWFSGDRLRRKDRAKGNA